MTGQQRVLFIGLEKAYVSRFEEVLGTRDILMELEPDPAAACDRLHDERFNGVVSAYPLPTGALGLLISTLRDQRCLSVGAGLVLLAPADSLRAANGLIGRGVAKVLSTRENPLVLAIVLERTIEVVQPMAQRLPVRLPITVRIDGEDRLCQTENLSGGGMLVASDEPPPVGTRLVFTLTMGDEQISGEAQVVRRVNTEREPVAGFGARFSSFDGDGQSRLLARLREAYPGDTS